MIVLGIESTCDETACSIVKNGKEIFSNVVASQHDIHSQYGGVFPELASRRHDEVIIPIINQALREAGVGFNDIDLIAVAHGPGLMGPLLVGLNTAKALALALNKPLIGINHIEAHLYASVMSQEIPPAFPCLGVVLSGAHTSLVHIESIGQYRTLGYTIDDAVGEAFDKVAKIIDLPYPGGPKIEQLAKEGDPKKHLFKVGQSKKNSLCFSFSGIKTGVLYAVKGQNGRHCAKTQLSHDEKADIAASFQTAVFNDIINKTLKACQIINTKTILFGGGVTNSRSLRDLFKKTAPEYNFIWPAAGLSLDNAAMIAGLGYHSYNKEKIKNYLDLEPMTRISLSS